MRRYRMWHLTGRRMIVAGLGAALVACGRAPEPAIPVGPGGSGDTTPIRYGLEADSGYAVIGLPPHRSLERPRPGEIPPRYVGILEEGVGPYVADPAKFVRRVDSIAWVGMVRPRRCEGRLCSIGFAKTWVAVQGVEDGDMIVLDSLDARGVLMARAVNTGKHTDALTGMRPQEQRYLLVRRVPEGDSTRLDASILILSRTRDGLTLREVPGQEPPSECVALQHRPHRFGFADFRNCSDNSVVSVANPVDRFAKGTWMACIQGCCTSSFPSLRQ